MKVFIIVASALLVLLNIFDVYSTTIALNNGGEELNPFMDWLMSHLGVLPAMLFMKITFVGLLIWAGHKALNKKELSKREFVAVIGSYSGLILTYGYFMYNNNLPWVMVYQ